MGQESTILIRPEALIRAFGGFANSIRPFAYIQFTNSDSFKQRFSGSFVRKDSFPHEFRKQDVS